jgi:hypothetical protein
MNTLTASEPPYILFDHTLSGYDDPPTLASRC